MFPCSTSLLIASSMDGLLGESRRRTTHVACGAMQGHHAPGGLHSVVPVRETCRSRGVQLGLALLCHFAQTADESARDLF